MVATSSMSASSEEDYQSAEDREDGENDINIIRLSKDLGGACVSEKYGSDSVQGPRQEPDSETGCSNGGNDLGGVTEPDINRTTDTTLKEAFPPDGQDKPTSDDSQTPIEPLTEEEITVRAYLRCDDICLPANLSIILWLKLRNGRRKLVG